MLSLDGAGEADLGSKRKIQAAAPVRLDKKARFLQKVRGSVHIYRPSLCSLRGVYCIVSDRISAPLLGVPDGLFTPFLSPVLLAHTSFTHCQKAGQAMGDGLPPSPI